MKRLRPTPKLTSALTMVATLGALAAGRPAPAAAQAASVSQLRYPPLPAFEIPQPQRTVLPNGMVVMLLEDHELPLVEATALIRTGSRLEPAGKAGVADLTGRVLRSGGTERMNGDQLDDYLDGKAASIEAAVAGDHGRASLSALKEDFPEVLSVFADVLRRPAFAEDKLAVAKLAARSYLSRQNDSPQGILFREFNKVVYGPDSPYARVPTYASLDAVGRDDLVAWHRAYFRPENVVLGIVGDFEPREVLALVEKTFGDWPRGGGPRPEIPAAGATKSGVFYAEKADITQSNIVMGNLGILRTDPDYFAVEVMNQVLSGGFGSRLFSNVRTRKGLAYAVFGQVGSDWDHPGTTLLFMTTKTATTGAGIEALLAEARDMTKSPPTEEEVEKAKRAILNSFVFNSDSKAEVLAQQIRYEYHGYPLDWLTRYRKGIEAVTVAEVRAAAAKHLQPERFAIVVVGPSAGTDRPLSDFGPVTPLDISIPGAPGRPASTR